MKKSFSYLLGIVFLLVTFCGCKKQEVTKVTKLEFTEGNYSISEREDMNMRAVLVFETQPAEAAESQKIEWAVSDESIAYMNGNYLTPKKAGSVIVTATVMGVSDQCEVVIEPIAITKITLSQTDEQNLFIGQSVTTSIQVEPSDANVDNVGISYNADVVDVEKLENGDYKITAKAKGATAFMASYKNVSAQFTVTSAVNEITKIVLVESNVLFITTGVATKLTPKITCTNNNLPPTYPQLIWKKGNTVTGEFTLSDDGTITMLKHPTSGFISVEYARNSDVYAQAMVVSQEPKTIESFTLKAENTTPLWNEEFNVVVDSYTPDGADLSKLSWTTSTSDVQLVSTGLNADGKRYATFRSIFQSGFADRNVTIRASAEGLSQSVMVTVTRQAPTSFTVSPNVSVCHFSEGESSVGFMVNVNYLPVKLLDADKEFTFTAKKFTSVGSSSTTNEIKFGNANKGTDGVVYTTATCTNTNGGLYEIVVKSSNGITASCNVTVLPAITQSNLDLWFDMSNHIGCFMNKEFEPTVTLRSGLYYGEGAIKIDSKKSNNETYCKPSSGGKFYFTLLDIGSFGATEVDIKFHLLTESTVYTAKCGVVNQCKSLVFKLANTSGGGTYEVEPVKIAGTANEYNLNGNGPAWLNKITATLSDGSKIYDDKGIDYSTAVTVNIDGKEALVYNYKDGTSTRKSSYIWIKGYDGNNNIKIYYKY